MITFITILCINYGYAYFSNVQNVKSVRELSLEIEFNNNSIIDVFRQIEKFTEYTFAYDHADIDSKLRITKRYDQTSKVADILYDISKDAGLSFKQINNNIIVTKIRLKKDQKNAIIEVIIQTQNVSGKVTSPDSPEGLPGVNILERGTKNGTVTDLEGNYQFTVSENAVLIFSSVGYLTQELPIGNQAVINVSLRADVQQLQELVVIGYGAVKKSDLTGSVSSISSEELTQTPVTDISRALLGHAAGVSVSEISGQPGSNTLIRIRGTNSLHADNTPLFVVDGVPLQGTIGSELNVDDIASIEVLKDASSTAIYGVRGANGVIIITTKRGREGRAIVNYDGYVGFQNVIRKIDLLNADEFKQLHIDAFNATGATPLAEVVNSTADTDWQEEVFGSALQQSHQFSLSGGSDATRYFVSVNYLNQEGLIDNTAFSRLSFRLNGDQRISDRFNASTSLTFSRAMTDRNNEELLANATLWAPPTLPIRDANGRFTTVNQPFPRTNPVGLRDGILMESTINRLIGNFTLSYNIVNDLSAEVNAGTDLMNTNNNNYTPSTLYEGSQGISGMGSRSNTIALSWVTDFLLRYQRTSLDHNISALGGFTLQEFQVDGFSGTARNFPNDLTTIYNLGAASNFQMVSNLTESALVSYLGRINYIFRDRYLFTFTGRYDGSSRMAPGNKYDFFPSGAISWRIYEEGFFNDIELISDLKIRVSYGITGNQAVSPYSQFSLFTTTQSALGPGLRIGSLGNPNLKWEKTRQLDIGIDMGLFENRVYLTADYYHKRTSDLLRQIALPASSGFITDFGDRAIANIGEVENKGFEFQLATTNLTGALNWNTSLNVSLNRNKLLNLGHDGEGNRIDTISSGASIGAAGYFRLILGQPLDVPFGHIVTGLDEQGNIAFLDINGDGEIDDRDQVVLGNIEPRFSFGFRNEMGYRNLNLSFLVIGSIGHDAFVRAKGASYAMNGQFNILREVYEQRGVASPLPRSDRPGSVSPNSLFMADGTFVKLRDITLAYDLPRSLLNNMNMNRLRIYISGQNLVRIFNNYPLYDPEMGRSGNDAGGYPNNKSLTLGLNLTF